MKTGIICGSFDLIHNGHINLIKRAKTRCDILIVGVNSDRHILLRKKHKPVLPQDVRVEIVRSLKYVSQAYIIESGMDLVAKMISLGIKIDEYYRGDDARYTDWQRAENQQLLSFGIKPVYFKYTKNISSTDIRNKLKK